MFNKKKIEKYVRKILEEITGLKTSQIITTPRHLIGKQLKIKGKNLESSQRKRSCYIHRTKHNDDFIALLLSSFLSL